MPLNCFVTTFLLFNILLAQMPNGALYYSNLTMTVDRLWYIFIISLTTYHIGHNLPNL